MKQSKKPKTNWPQLGAFIGSLVIGAGFIIFVTHMFEFAAAGFASSEENARMKGIIRLAAILFFGGLTAMMSFLAVDTKNLPARQKIKLKGWQNTLEEPKLAKKRSKSVKKS